MPHHETARSALEEENEAALRGTGELLEAANKFNTLPIKDNPINGGNIKPVGDPYAGFAKGLRDK